MILEIQRKDADGTVLLELQGRITLGRDCQELEWMIDGLIREKRTRVIFDLSGVKYMDSSGVGILVMCSGKMKEAGGELRLAAATGVVDHTLKLTRMNLIVPTYATLAEAQAGFAASAQAR